MPDNLGKGSSWHIRDFPETLREQIVEQARAEKISVAEFLTAHLIALRDAGWPRPGEVVGERFATRQTSLADVERAVAVACNYAAHADKMPPGIAASARRLISEQLWRLRGGRPGRRTDNLIGANQ